MLNGSKLPHSLRLAIFLLRITLGLNFVYLGFGTIFNTGLGKELSGRSLTSFYAWLSDPGSAGSFQFFLPYAFLAIGACLLLGLFTRTMSLVGIVLTLMNYISHINYATLGVSQLINDEVLVVICLLVLVFANAGTYLGIDNFIHIHLSSRHKR